MFDLNPKLDPQDEEFFRSVINEGAQTPGNTEELISPQDIPWAKPDLIKKGTRFFFSHITSLFCANLSALVFGYSVKSDAGVLLRTGNFNREDIAITRIFSTGSRIGKWFQGDLLDPKSEGFETCKKVRRMHAAATKVMNRPLPVNEPQFAPTEEKSELAKAIRDDLAFIKTDEAPTHLFTFDPPVPVNQFDMMMTQFGFIFTVYRVPETVGVKRDNPDIEGFIHTWAVIGRLLGLEDRYNLALRITPELVDKLFVQVGMASLKNLDSLSVSLMEELFKGLGNCFPIPFLFTLKGWLYFGLKTGVPGFEGKNIKELMTWRDHVCQRLLSFILAMISFSAIIRYILNALWGMWICYASVRRGMSVTLPKGMKFGLTFLAVLIPACLLALFI